MSQTRPASVKPRAANACIGPLASCSTLGCARIGQPGGQRPLVVLGQRRGIEVGAVVVRGRDGQGRQVPRAASQVPVDGQAGPLGRRMPRGQPARRPGRAGELTRSPARACLPAGLEVGLARARRPSSVRPCGSVWYSRSRSTRNCRVSNSWWIVSRSQALGSRSPAPRRPSRRQVADQRGELAVAQHAGQVLAQRVAGLALDLVDAVDQRGQRAELGDPLRSRSSPPRRGCRAGCRSGRREPRRSRGTAPGTARTSRAPRPG